MNCVVFTVLSKHYARIGNWYVRRMVLADNLRKYLKKRYLKFYDPNCRLWALASAGFSLRLRLHCPLLKRMSAYPIMFRRR